LLRAYPFRILHGSLSRAKWDFYQDLLQRYSVHAQGEPRMPPVVPFGNPYEVFSSVGLDDVEVKRRGGDRWWTSHSRSAQGRLTDRRP
jgi:hypothetical protein